MTKLSDIAGLHSGIYEKILKSGDVYYVQSKYFDKNLNFNDNIKPEIMLTAKLEKHFLRINDIIFAAKGSNNFAVRYFGNKKPAVASSSFFVIRINEIDLVNPDYLTWFLNCPLAQKYFKRISKGTNIESITMGDLLDLEIPIPSLETQVIIAKTGKLNNEITKLKRDLNELNKLNINNSLIKAALK